MTVSRNERANLCRPRARDIGLRTGILGTGPLNGITDVLGVKVGHTTLIQGDKIRTGVTAILPHPGNLFREKVPGAVFVGNAFGKLVGSTQVNELGEIETPILLTSTLSVHRVADAVVDYMLALPGNKDVQSINPLVGETNDGELNDIRGRHIRHEHAIKAIKSAHGGPVDEGAVGAGTGLVAFGFKGGIGTSSRRLPASRGGFTVGVLVQANFGGILTIAGAPVGLELGRHYLSEEIKIPIGATRATSRNRQSSKRKNSKIRTIDRADGSIMVVVATDAPIENRNLRRLAARAMLGLARTGSVGSHASGDYVIAFSSVPSLRIKSPASSGSGRSTESARSSVWGSGHAQRTLINDAMSPLFLAVIEATEEAVYNSLFKSATTTGRGKTIEGIPVERTISILQKYGVLAPRS